MYQQGFNHIVIMHFFEISVFLIIENYVVLLIEWETITIY